MLLCAYPIDYKKSSFPVATAVSSNRMNPNANFVPYYAGGETYDEGQQQQYYQQPYPEGYDDQQYYYEEQTPPTGAYHPTTPLMALDGAPVTALARNSLWYAGGAGRKQMAPLEVLQNDGMLVSRHQNPIGDKIDQLYQAFYGSPLYMLKRDRMTPRNAHIPPFHEFCSWGVSSLVCMADELVASVCPGGARLHTQGGMIVAKSQPMEGLVAGARAHDFLYVGGLKGCTCLDWHLQPISSCEMTVTCMASLDHIVIAGTNTGSVRLLDPSTLRPTLRIDTPHACVTNLAASGNWIASVGWGKMGNGLPLSDPSVYLYDVRYGKGVPQPFLGSGPRWLDFAEENKLVVASGNAGNATLQILEPLSDNVDPNSFISPQLETNESITSLLVQDEHLAIGTSQGRVCRYLKAGAATSSPNAIVDIPSWVPPPLSVDASMLLDKNRPPSLNLYIPPKHCTASTIKDGPLASHPLCFPSKLQIQDSLPSVVSTADLEIKLEGNPNKILHTASLYKKVYQPNLQQQRKKATTKSDVPPRYRLTQRPSAKFAATFNHSEYNQSGLLPGWVSGSGCWCCSKHVVSPFLTKDYPPTMPNAFCPPVLMLLYLHPLATRNVKDELAHVFHRIDRLSALALISGGVGAWAPLNYLAALQANTEADRLQILDGSPAAVDKKAQAFFRFLLYQIEHEDGISFCSKTSQTNITKSLTVELEYLRKTQSFGEVLLDSLGRETRLRAWNPSSKSYENIVQRKFAMDLPTMLSLCAGHYESSSFNKLPTMVEVELSDKVLVRELLDDGTWAEHVGMKVEVEQPMKRRYALDMVLSLVSETGHYVLHARIHPKHRQHLKDQQIAVLEEACREQSDEFANTLVGDSLPEFQKCLESLAKEEGATEEWLLINGYVVSRSSVDDARAFPKYKEPLIILYRDVELQETIKVKQSLVPVSAMRTSSLNGVKAPYNEKVLPDRGELVAFDAEFVSVQEEEYFLEASGSKVTTRETRHALARISAIDCSTGQVLFDDHVKPQEPVVDYLTRFSGIVENDLDPLKSPHHLIRTRAAYLKLRLLVERGCIFVGHGLKQDFWTLNLAVPPTQVIDTVAIFHKPGQRYISLRFLTNFVLKRDMQQEIHNSEEDAMAAWELFQASKALKANGKFEETLDALYAHGQKVDWKLGV